MKKKIIFILVLAGFLAVGRAFYLQGWDSVEEVSRARPLRSVFQEIDNIVQKPQNIGEIPQRKILPGGTHAFQTFNNCGPASLSIALSFYDIFVTQGVLGNELRPYQNPQGDNDDKSVTLAEVAEKSKDFGFVPYRRPNGNMDMVKAFIANDMPVITRTWLKPNEDIGHFRVIKGYDNSAGEIIQDDSYDGKNLWFSYAEYNEIWKKFNYEYLVLVPSDKVAVAEEILGEDLDEKVAWEKAANLSRSQLASNPSDVYARFNLSVALYEIGDYEGSVEEFEKVENQLAFRTLWYQIEPIQAYYELENYDRVFEITDRVLTTGNRAFSELYYIRGQIYLNRNQTDLAKSEFEKAVVYNVNYEPAKLALEKL